MKHVLNIFGKIGWMVALALFSSFASAQWISVSSEDPATRQSSSSGTQLATGQYFVSPHSGSITSIGVKFKSSFSGSLKIYAGLAVNESGQLTGEPIATQSEVQFAGINQPTDDFQVISLSHPIAVEKDKPYSFLLFFDEQPVFFTPYVAPLSLYPQGHYFVTQFPSDTALRNVNLMFEISGKFHQTLAFTSTPPTQMLVGGAYTPVVTSDTDLPLTITVAPQSSDVCSFSGTTVTFGAAGTCTILADQAGDDDYLAAEQISQSITVDRIAQTINFTSAAPSDVVVGDSYTPTAASSSDLLVTFSISPSSIESCSFSGTTVTFDAAGTCTILADQGGNSAHTPADQASQSITVSRALQTITLTTSAPSDAVVGGSYSPLATSTSGLPVAFTIATSSSDVCSLVGGEVRFNSAGTCTILVDQGGDTAHLPADQLEQSFAIEPLPESPVAPTPVPALGAFGLMGLAGVVGAAGVAMSRRRKSI